MPYSALLEYIRCAKDCGTSDVEIINRLHKAGWYKVDIEDALDLYRRLTANTTSEACAPEQKPPAPSISERIAPRHIDRHTLLIAIIAFTIGYVVYVGMRYY
jgi:hypothetical protein